MKIAVLTSSRADYYILSPLLIKLKNDPFFDLNLIVFGTHLSKNYGHTIDDIIQDGYKITRKIRTLPENDSPLSISESIGKTIMKFSKLWEEETFDLILALGDRYEIFAAIASTIPFNLRIAHIHGGEVTTGAIDNIFRHSISLASQIHLTSALVYKKKLERLLGSRHNIFNVGALSFDNLKNIKYLTFSEFNAKFGVDLSKPYILITFHPETVESDKNAFFIDEIISALRQVKHYQFIISMPNADTKSQIIRQRWIEFQKENGNVHLFENLGKNGYLTCMKYCSLMLGNSSSGFIEASFFPKPVVNIGNRQKGRILTPNIIQCEANTGSIISAIHRAESMKLNKPASIYGAGNTASKIISILKNLNLNFLYDD